MGRRITFVAGYFIASLSLFSILIFSLLTTIYISDDMSRAVRPSAAHKGPQYQSVPEAAEKTDAEFQAEDARISALTTFFSDYDSPLLPHARFIVEQADKHGIDYRLIPAIAMKESTLCHRIPKNSHNCWGYGIYGSKVTRFENYEVAIATVTEGLAKRYIAIGLTDPYEIMTKYNPVSDGAWADGVSYVMERITMRL